MEPEPGAVGLSERGSEAVLPKHSGQGKPPRPAVPACKEFSLGSQELRAPAAGAGAWFIDAYKSHISPL